MNAFEVMQKAAESVEVPKKRKYASRCGAIVADKRQKLEAARARKDWDASQWGPSHPFQIEDGSWRYLEVSKANFGRPRRLSKDSDARRSVKAADWMRAKRQAEAVRRMQKFEDLVSKGVFKHDELSWLGIGSEDAIEYPDTFFTCMPRYYLRNANSLAANSAPVGVRQQLKRVNHSRFSCCPTPLH